MPAVSSPITTTQPYIPAISAAQRTRIPGVPQHFATVADLVTAVTQERANIAAGLPLWLDGTRIFVATEPGVSRLWSLDTAGADDAAKAAASHARAVVLGQGASVTLAGDANVVLAQLGAPSSGTGANGDCSLDWVGNVLYTKAAGAWTAADLSNIVRGISNAQVAALVAAQRAGVIDLNRDDELYMGPDEIILSVSGSAGGSFLLRPTSGYITSLRAISGTGVGITLRDGLTTSPTAANTTARVMFQASAMSLTQPYPVPGFRTRDFRGHFFQTGLHATVVGTDPVIAIGLR